MGVEDNQISRQCGGDIDDAQLKSTFVAGRLGLGDLVFVEIGQNRRAWLPDKRLEIRQVKQIGYDDSVISIQGRNGIDHVECCTEHSPPPVFTRH